MTFYDASLDVVIAGVSAAIGVVMERMSHRRRPKCASANSMGNGSERCAGLADPRCTAGNCTHHCVCYCGKRCD